MEDKPIRVGMAAAGFPRKPGKTLPNGAIILAEVEIRRYEFRRDSVVLAINPGGYQPFVSWHRMVTTDSPLATGGFQTVDSCCYGRYSMTLESAMIVFNERVEEYQKRQELIDMNEEGRERLRLEAQS